MKMKRSVGALLAFLTLVLFFLVPFAVAAESADQYRSVYHGYKSVEALEPKDAESGSDSVTMAYFVDLAGQQKYWLLRFYVPASLNGTIAMGFFCPQQAMVGLVARLGAPPQCDLEAYTYATNPSTAYYGGLPWDDRLDISLQDLRDRDYRKRNMGGILDVVKDYSGKSDGEWLFIKFLFDGLSIPNIVRVNLQFDVNAEQYRAWYNNQDNFDANGDPKLVVKTLPAPEDARL